MSKKSKEPEVDFPRQLLREARVKGWEALVLRIVPNGKGPEAVEEIKKILAKANLR